ncbi:MAG: ABC transporter permease subunit [Candidatus Poribacteria bacterium]|nr:ABC transporter permease subunit [Candidatus Poribacteria bacterium]
MIISIAKRELYDNTMSLRFALIALLMLTVMVANAAVSLGTYNEHISHYRRRVAHELKEMRQHAEHFPILVLYGPGELHKMPSALSFCANGGEAFLSTKTDGRPLERWWGDYPARFNGIWRMTYPQSNPNQWNFLPESTQMDWAFLIGIVLSFSAILFTFDAISGERTRGTLRLMLANSVPRHVVLGGKFLGALMSIGLPFLMAVLVNLFLLYSSGSIRLDTSDWVRLGAIVLIGFVYIAIFITLGLLISSRARQSSSSLMVFTLIWVVWVILVPNTAGLLARSLKPAMTSDEFRERREELYQQVTQKYLDRGLLDSYFDPREIPPTKIALLWGEYHLEESLSDERFLEEHLRAQLDQVVIARSLARLSPTAVVQYAIESLAGTGFSRHLQFLSQVKIYVSEFRDFLVEVDKADPKSPHVLFFRPAMSWEPVPFETIPKFQDRYSFGDSLNDATVDVLLLVLVFVMLSAAVFLSFLRVDI